MKTTAGVGLVALRPSTLESTWLVAPGRLLDWRNDQNKISLVAAVPSGACASSLTIAVLAAVPTSDERAINSLPVGNWRRKSNDRRSSCYASRSRTCRTRHILASCAPQTARRGDWMGPKQETGWRPLSDGKPARAMEASSKSRDRRISSDLTIKAIAAVGMLLGDSLPLGLGPRSFPRDFAKSFAAP